jgi:hypothetical protein
LPDRRQLRRQGPPAGQRPAQLEQVLTGNQVVHDIRVYPAPDMASSPPCPGETPIWPLVAGKFADTGQTVRRHTADSNDVNISVGTLIPSGQPQASGR